MMREKRKNGQGVQEKCVQTRHVERGERVQEPGKPGRVRFLRRLRRSGVRWTAYIGSAYFTRKAAARRCELVTLVGFRSNWRSSYTQPDHISRLPSVAVGFAFREHYGWRLHHYRTNAT